MRLDLDFDFVSASGEKILDSAGKPFPAWAVVANFLQDNFKGFSTSTKAFDLAQRAYKDKGLDLDIGDLEVLEKGFANIELRPEHLIKAQLQVAIDAAKRGEVKADGALS